MPSLLVHLAISNQYLKHGKKRDAKIKDYNAFRKGSVAPDFSKDFLQILNVPQKERSHYSFKGTVKTDFQKFLKKHATDLNDDYWKGYLLHLITDDLFYNKSFTHEYQQASKDAESLYADYSNLSKWLITKYHIEHDDAFFTKRVEFLSQPRSGKTQFIKKHKLKKFINKMASLDFEKFIQKHLH